MKTVRYLGKVCREGAYVWLADAGQTELAPVVIIARDFWYRYSGSLRFGWLLFSFCCFLGYHSLHNKSVQSDDGQKSGVGKGSRAITVSRVFDAQTGSASRSWNEAEKEVRQNRIA